MANTNFLQFDIQQTNMLSDANYASDLERTSGFVTGISRSILFNKTLFQTSTMSTAIANVLVSRGYNAMDNNLSSLQEAIDGAFSMNRGLPIGSIFPTTAPITTPPEGFLLPDGEAFDPSEYSELATAYRIGPDTYKYGQVYQDGVWWPKTPDLRGYFLRVHNPQASTGLDAGRTIGSKQGDAIRNLTGQFYHVVTSGQGIATGIFKIESQSPDLVRGQGQNWWWNKFSVDISDQVPTADENRPNNVALTYLIVAKNEANLGSGASAAEWGQIEGTLSDQTDLQNALNNKQDLLTAGNGITISSNTISAKGMVGATGGNAGSAGMVPAPSATDGGKYLKGDGTWGLPIFNNNTNTLEF